MLIAPDTLSSEGQHSSGRGLFRDEDDLFVRRRWRTYCSQHVPKIIMIAFILEKHFKAVMEPMLASDL